MARNKQNKSQNDGSNCNQLLITSKHNNSEDINEDNKCDNKTMSSQIRKNCGNEEKGEKTIVCFIELLANNSIGRQPKQMQNAFSSMKSHKFDPKWIKPNEVMTIESIENHLFIMDSFDGQVFDYLVEKKARIIGPLTVLYCYSSDCKNRFDSIPIKSAAKLDLINKIEKMCGTFSKDFTKRVTHLVSDSVRTKKYCVAKSIGITVVSSEWVDFCWERYQHLTCHASDQQIINKYILPIFKNLIITVSQVDVDERNNIMEIVKKNGGVYSPALKLNVANTLLLLKEPNGEKFKYARIKNIPCLHIKWLYDSLEKGYALSEDKYAIVSTSEECSTSQTTERCSVDNKLKSRDSHQSLSANSLNQSVELVSNVSIIDSNTAITDTSTQGIIGSIESLTSGKRDEHFLEGCVIYAVGFDRLVIETLKTAVMSCGSLFLNEFKPLATHTIIGPNFNQSDNELLLKNKNCRFVTIEWFYDCLKHEECCDYSKYEFKNRKNIENNKQNNTQEIFKLPLNVCPESRKALEKWTKASETHKSESHKSLGDGLNETIHIEWSNSNIDDMPSQRPYLRSLSKEMSEVNDEVSDEVNDEKNEDIDGHKNNSNESEENEVEIIENLNTDNEVIANESLNSNKAVVIEVMRGFMFSGYDEQTKAEFTNIVEQLEGFVVDSNQVLGSVTHLIIRDPSATEKTLSAIASGIWILKEDYLFESKKMRTFVAEEQFEWGFSLSNSFGEFEKKSVRKRLMISAIEWRKHLQIENERRKLFDNWHVLMVNETKLTIPYTQVLKCGNANVVDLSPDLEVKDLEQFKYAFIDHNQLKQLPKYALKLIKQLIKRNKLFKIDFVSHYILSGPNSSTFASSISKLLVKDSTLNDFDSRDNRKRPRDHSQDSDDNYSSKHRK